MNAVIEKAIEAHEALPQDMQEPLVAHLVEQAAQYRAFKAAVQLGLDDEAAGRTRAWDYEDFLKRARSWEPR